MHWMDLSTIDPLYSLSGFVVGMLVGQTGVGGGSLMTPLLILLFNVHPATAVGTDLLFAAATKSVGTLVHSRNKTVDWRITLRLAAGSVPATLLTLVALSHWTLVDRRSATLISAVLGVALILTAVAIILRPRLLKLAGGRLDLVPEQQTMLFTIMTGAVLGFLVSITSVGAGALGVTALIMLYPTTRLSKIVGSDIAHAVPLTLIAGAGHWLLGSVSWVLLVSLLIGSIPGIIIGSQFSARVPEFVLRPVMALILVFVGGRLIL
jgi:uncharacterized membrane protein YfcA